MYLSDGKVKLSFYKPGKAQSDITAGEAKRRRKQFLK